MKECGKLTCSSLIYLLCRDSKYIQHFNHYLHDDVRHRLSWSNLGIGLHASEEVLDPLKYVNKSLLGSNNVLRRLRSSRIKLGCKETSRMIRTWRRTPAPAKITFAGEKT